MKWDVELSYGIGFTVTGVEAQSKEDAVRKAKALVEDTDINTGIQVDAGCLEFDQCTYARQTRQGGRLWRRKQTGCVNRNRQTGNCSWKNCRMRT